MLREANGEQRSEELASVKCDLLDAVTRVETYTAFVTDYLLPGARQIDDDFCDQLTTADFINGRNSKLVTQIDQLAPKIVATASAGMHGPTVDFSSLIPLLAEGFRLFENSSGLELVYGFDADQLAACFCRDTIRRFIQPYNFVHI